MASQAQINPDLLHSQPGTPSGSDPITYEAKCEFCYNRATPGFNTSIIYIPLESKKDFVNLVYELLIQYHPATFTERILLEKMAHNHWNSLRAMRYQSLIMKNTIDSGMIHDGLKVLMRYQTIADRAFHRALSELLKFQKERKNEAIGFESQKAQPPAPKPAEPQAETPRNPPESAPPEPPPTSGIAVPAVATVPTPIISLEGADETVSAVREMLPSRKKAA